MAVAATTFHPRVHRTEPGYTAEGNSALRQDHVLACGLSSSFPPTCSCPEPGLAPQSQAAMEAFVRECHGVRCPGLRTPIPHCPASRGPAGYHQLWLELQILFLVNLCRTGNCAYVEVGVGAVCTERATTAVTAPPREGKNKLGVPRATQGNLQFSG